MFTFFLKNNLTNYLYFYDKIMFNFKFNYIYALKLNIIFKIII